MKYSTGQAISIGDHVIADGMIGVVVCDFDNRKFLEGYADWDTPTIAMSLGGTLSSGIIINTIEAGLVHFQEEDGDIELMKAAPSRSEI